MGAYELRYLDSSTNTITTSNRIVVGAGAWETVTTPGVGQRHAGVDQYFHPDWLGSTRYLTDNSGTTTPSGYRCGPRASYGGCEWNSGRRALIPPYQRFSLAGTGRGRGLRNFR